MTAAWITAAAGAILALVYQAWLNRPESALRSGLKTAPLALFALAALLAGAPWGLALGLGLGALGDYALSRRGDAMFQLGLGSFALAHVAYAIVFVGIEGRLPLLDLNAARWLGLAALVVMAHSTVVWLLPFARGMQRPVAAYVAIITLMGIAALHLPAAYWLTMVGAGLFVVSDLLLAVRLFRMEEHSPAARAASHAVWPLYWLGQGLILAGIGFA